MSLAAPTIGFDVRPGNSGPARYVAALARGLEEAGWNIALLAPDAERSAPPPSSSPPPAPRRRGAAVRGFVPKFARCWAGFGRETSRLAAQLRLAKIDLLHTQNTGCEEMPVAARWARMPRVLGTFHVDSSYDLARVRSDLAHRALEWYSNRSLHRAIAVSQATKRDWVQRTGIAPERVAVIPNGIDPSRFQRRRSRAAAREQLGLSPDAIVLGGLGRLDAAKGFSELIEALAILRRDLPEVMVAIAGAGPLLGELTELAASRGVTDRVVWLGFQQDVNLVLEACEVFVLPSLCEALPFALLEAMALELPAVGTTVGGVPEVIVPGETGFLAPPRNAEALAAAIRPLVRSPRLRELLGRNGRERVVKHFHERDMVRQTIAVYREMTREHHPRSRQTVS